MKLSQILIVILTHLVKIVKWLAGFFEDQKGSPSSKRAIAYFVIYVLYKIAMENLHLKVPVDRNILIVFLLIELVALGVIGSEFFLKNSAGNILDPKKKDESETES